MHIRIILLIWSQNGRLKVGETITLLEVSSVLQCNVCQEKCGILYKISTCLSLQSWYIVITQGK